MAPLLATRVPPDTPLDGAAPVTADGATHDVVPADSAVDPRNADTLNLRRGPAGPASAPAAPADDPIPPFAVPDGFHSIIFRSDCTNDGHSDDGSTSEDTKAVLQSEAQRGPSGLRWIATLPDGAPGSAPPADAPLAEDADATPPPCTTRDLHAAFEALPFEERNHIDAAARRTAFLGTEGPAIVHWLRNHFHVPIGLHWPIDFLRPGEVSYPIYQERLRLFHLAALAAPTASASSEAPLQAPPDPETLRLRYAQTFGHPPIQGELGPPPADNPFFAPLRRALDDPLLLSLLLPPQAPLSAAPALNDANSGTPTHLRPTTAEHSDSVNLAVDVDADGHTPPTQV
jgi:hypothetical protein